MDVNTGGMHGTGCQPINSAPGPQHQPDLGRGTSMWRRTPFCWTAGLQNDRQGFGVSQA